MKLEVPHPFPPADPSDVTDMMVGAATAVNATDLTMYMVDFEQRILEPIRGQSTHAEVPHAEQVGASMAGRAFLHREAEVSERPEGIRVWVPILEGSDPTGVLALTVPAGGPEILAACEDLGILAGYLIATHARVTDVFNLYRRRKAMTLAASMQWDLLPPLTVETRRVVAAGMIEPAYEVGGDCFDYAVNGPTFDVAIMDSVGHGVRSSVLAGLAVGCYRHGRREGRTLEHLHRAMDAAIEDHCRGDGFVTGQLGRLEVSTGSLSLINAGHPPPLLVRRGHVIGELECPPDPPWGTGAAQQDATVVVLEPGDSVLFYSDGVIEERGRPSENFGVERLADLAGRHFSDQLPLGLIVRLLTQAVLDHHGGQLHDDATVLAVNWPAPSSD